MESDGPANVSTISEYSRIEDAPNHALKLLLAYVGRDLAVNLPGAQGHGKRLCHVGLYLCRNGFVGVGRTNPDVRRSLVLKFARSELQNFGTRYQ
jgi:hypothetical protein